jgi:hypothetical protein
MIPEFDERGYLPAGVHPATMQELDERFGRQSEVRRAQIESLRWLAALIERAGARRLIVNGSFVTDVLEPNDVDCVVLLAENYPRDAKAAEELVGGLPFIDLELVEDAEFAILVEEFFATDRNEFPKGVIEVVQ